MFDFIFISMILSIQVFIRSFTLSLLESALGFWSEVSWGYFLAFIIKFFLFGLIRIYFMRFWFGASKKRTLNMRLNNFLVNISNRLDKILVILKMFIKNRVFVQDKGFVLWWSDKYNMCLFFWFFFTRFLLSIILYWNFGLMILLNVVRGHYSNNIFSFIQLFIIFYLIACNINRIIFRGNKLIGIGDNMSFVFLKLIYSYSFLNGLIYGINSNHWLNR